MPTNDNEDGYRSERSRPDRRKRRKKRVLGLFPRIMMVAFTLAFTIIVCAALGSKIVQPYQMSRDQAQRMAVLNTQLADTNAQNATLERQTAYLQRSDGIEAEARDKGYLKPGEISLVIENPPAVTAAPAPSNGFADRLRHAWDHVIGK
jgi:cell division protein FtsB